MFRSTTCWRLSIRPMPAPLLAGRAILTRRSSGTTCAPSPRRWPAASTSRRSWPDECRALASADAHSESEALCQRLQTGELVADGDEVGRTLLAEGTHGHCVLRRS